MIFPPARRAAPILQSVVAIGAFACFARALDAQRTQTGNDIVAPRLEYADLNDLLGSLPKVPPPVFDEGRALWLGALPLACLDRLQPRPGGRGAGAGRATATTDSANTRGRGGTVDSTIGVDARAGVGRGAGGGNNGNNGAGYFWVATYSLVPDHDRLRAFWGCNDWHSAVASTWVTTRLLKSFPTIALEQLAREKLNAHLGKSNLDGEMAFFRATAAAINPIPSANQTGLFERPYGFAWLLKLYSELRTWRDENAQRWAANMAPLASWMADSLGAYVVNLVEPVRSGAQTNTATSFTLALDYADALNDTRLRRQMVTAARKLFLADTNCATQLERATPAGDGRAGRGGQGIGRGAIADSTGPNDLTANAPPARGGATGQGGGPVVYSPCLAEAALMSRVLDQRAYLTWLDRFLPPLESATFASLREAIEVPLTAPAPIAASGASTPPDTSTAARAAALATERARLAGLSFSRAQAMERIARALPAADPRVAVWHRLSAIQADRGFTLMRTESSGISWVPAQAFLYVTVRQP